VVWVREAERLGLVEVCRAKLPAEEREACRQLWADVVALLKTVDLLSPP
jgi:hypothetical protein